MGCTLDWLEEAAKTRQAENDHLMVVRCGAEGKPMVIPSLTGPEVNWSGDETMS